MRDSRTLNVWQRAHQVTLRVYTATRTFPKDQLHGLTSQIRRSAASIPTNLAEGCGRSGGAGFARFLNIAMGSASEFENRLSRAHDLKLLDADEHQALSADVIEMKRTLASLFRRPKAEC
jgi:four helix bundle protein